MGYVPKIDLGDPNDLSDKYLNNPVVLTARMILFNRSCLDMIRGKVFH